MSLKKYGLQSSHEPNSLGIARLVSVVVLSMVFLAIAPIVLRTQENDIELYPPGILMECRTKAFSQSKVELFGVYNDANGAQQKVPLPGWLGDAVYGTDVVSGVNTNQTSFINANRNKTAWQVRPSSDVMFRSLTAPGDPYHIHELWVHIDVPPQSRSLFSGTNNTAIPGVDVRLFPYNITEGAKPIASLSDAPPLDIYANDWVPLSQATYAHSTLDPYGVIYPLPDGLAVDFLIRILPSNAPSDPKNGRGNLVVTTNESVKSITVLDFLGGVGGAFTLCTGIYAFLFGIGRLRPWGIMQRYVSKRRLLSGMTSSVVSVRDETNRMNRMKAFDLPLNHRDSNIAMADVHNHNLALEQSRQYDTSTLVSSGTMDNATREQLIQRMQYLEKRTEELEGFQDRIETFYTAGDLFYRKPAGSN
ncbi:hypothetical protein BDF22DRAFT_682866 [Syncephalis plumigaleata]|nr:hypothetical protein BDF22DRAFT_682866 [Syncephalis plumigaleata]